MIINRQELLCEDGKVMELYVERPLRTFGLVIFTKAGWRMFCPYAAAFVDIGEERNAFLCRRHPHQGGGDKPIQQRSCMGRSLESRL